MVLVINNGAKVQIFHGISVKSAKICLNLHCQKSTPPLQLPHTAVRESPNRPLLMNHRLATVLTACLLAISFCPSADAISLALDSVAKWGRFPNFCVNVYRWGDRTFNTYDTAYVEGTGYKFNIKAKSEAWLDTYTFQLPDNYRINMASETNLSAGFYLTYLALSVGYDFNVGKYLGIGKTARQKFNFRFNCALFAADFYWITNDVGTHITSYGRPGDRTHCDIPFSGIDTRTFGLDTYYFFNNKRYSRAAAFNYSKIQKRSQGSWFLGFSYWTQQFKFDFTGVPEIVKDLPKEWADAGNHFNINNHNYAIRGGYGYNWVFARHWVWGVTESPIVGIKHGTVNSELPKISLSLYNRFQTSVVWNNRHFFAGFIFSNDIGFYFDRRQTLANSIFMMELSAGYRFNLW